jgi:hypothetical protein
MALGEISPVVLWLLPFLTQASAKKIAGAKAGLCHRTIEGTIL